MSLKSQPIVSDITTFLGLLPWAQTKETSPAPLEAMQTLWSPEDTYCTGSHAGTTNPCNCSYLEPRDHMGNKNSRDQANSQNFRTSAAKQTPQIPETKQATKIPAETYYWNWRFAGHQNHRLLRPEYKNKLRNQGLELVIPYFDV